jgi:hypothetical protein
MASTTKAIMKACNRTAKVTVSLRDDGNLDVAIESDCDVVMGYAERLGGMITAMDVYGFQESKINSDEIRGNLTPTCLVPNAIYNAAFLELGMMTRSLAQQAGENTVVLAPKEERIAPLRIPTSCRRGCASAWPHPPCSYPGRTTSFRERRAPCPGAPCPHR